MPDIQPFRGLRYRLPDADLAKVLAPPYDVITPAYQEELYARDPRNIVRVVLNRTAGDAAYDDGDMGKPGPRNRLLMRRDGAWELQRSK